MIPATVNLKDVVQMGPILKAFFHPQGNGEIEPFERGIRVFVGTFGRVPGKGNRLPGRFILNKAIVFAELLVVELEDR
jgi:hypothetical protein